MSGSVPSAAIASPKHPVASFFHVAFKACALLVYLTCEWFESDFVLNFVTVILLLAADFWTTSNVSGRLLVGLRYWNEIDESGVSRWRFESRDAEGMKAVRASEKTLFWYSLYAVPAAWLALAIVALARLHLGYLLVCAVALALGGANLVGYTKCDKDAQANVSNFARTAVWNSVMPSFMQKT